MGSLKGAGRGKELILHYIFIFRSHNTLGLERPIKDSLNRGAHDKLILLKHAARNEMLLRLLYLIIEHSPQEVAHTTVLLDIFILTISIRIDAAPAAPLRLPPFIFTIIPSRRVRVRSFQHVKSLDSAGDLSFAGQTHPVCTGYTITSTHGLGYSGRRV